MKGDFSFLAFDTAPHYSGVLHQQGRVLLDRDWNEAAAIASRWRTVARPRYLRRRSVGGAGGEPGRFQTAGRQ
jgi:hypothetical protein